MIKTILLFGVLSCCNVRSDDDIIDNKMCGRDSLCAAAVFLDSTIQVSQIESALSGSTPPYSLYDLQRAARACGLGVRAVTWNNPSEASFNNVSILHIKSDDRALSENHFVVCYGESSGGICISSFPHDPFLISKHNLGKLWNGTMLILEHKQSSGFNLELLKLNRLWFKAVLFVCIVFLGVKYFKMTRK